jgi:hypothetical protein
MTEIPMSTLFISEVRLAKKALFRNLSCSISPYYYGASNAAHLCEMAQ